MRRREFLIRTLLGAAFLGNPGRWRSQPATVAPSRRGTTTGRDLLLQLFIANLTTNVPSDRRLARSENENDRLIHVYRLA
jgi:hypothetical protein